MLIPPLGPHLHSALHLFQTWIFKASFAMAGESYFHLMLVITKGKSKKLILANIYRPPEGNKIAFINCLCDLVSEIDELDNYDVVLTGDFNINVLLEDNTKEYLCSTCEDFSLRQLITTPTRIAEQQTCIDLIFTNIIHVNAYGVADINISDHLPV